jgi:hypothetical protein
MERRLAAILAVDVVGYSRLMEQDEAGTFTRLRAHRKELFEPKIIVHHGHIFKLMGDGLLAEFASVVDAVECAVALQGGLAERNTIAPVEHRIDARIGINLGTSLWRKTTREPSIFMARASSSPTGCRLWPNPAASAFRRRSVHLNPDDPWPFAFLAASYIQLGREKEAADTIAAFNSVRVRHGGIPFVMDELMRSRPTFTPPPKSPLVRTLLRAGIPHNFNTPQFDALRLQASEIESLFFGHRLHGRDMADGPRVQLVGGCGWQRVEIRPWGQRRRYRKA